MTLASVAVLVGTELVGAGGAAGWAIGGLMELGEPLTHVLEGVFIALCAHWAVFLFARRARPRADPEPNTPGFLRPQVAARLPRAARAARTLV